MAKSMLTHLQESRSDVAWVKGPDSEGAYTFDNSLPNPQEILDLIASYDPADTLEDLKASRILEVDAKSQILISVGFTFDSKQFSLSQNAQLNWIGLKVADEAGVLSYPISVTTLQDAAYELQSSADLLSFYGTGVGTIKYVLDSGRAIKLLINSATSVEELDAVVDAR